MPPMRWKLLSSAAISLLIVILAYLNRAWLGEALTLLDQARPIYLLIAMGVIALSYLVSAQVFAVALSSLGHQVSILRLWATALTAIMISQAVPAGGVGSYAFLIGNFRRRGVSPGSATLIASLETLSYVLAMLLLFTFSILFLTTHGMATGQASYVAGGVALTAISTAIFVLSRPIAVLKGWLAGARLLSARLSGRNWPGEWAERLLDELGRGRGLMASQRRTVLLLVLIQLAALVGHSLAMLLVLLAFGEGVSLWIVLAAFGTALLTSTFNVLPGGGGTVEAALVAVLSQLGVGPAAVPAAITFRLLNFWLLAPLAAAGYHWLMHDPIPPAKQAGAPRGKPVAKRSQGARRGA
jgi:uncharacterized protein (TIRG00374 family)